MANKILDNSEGREVVSYIQEELPHSKEAKFAIGYFYLSGFQLVESHFPVGSGLKPFLKIVMGRETDSDTSSELITGYEAREKIKQELLEELQSSDLSEEKKGTGSFYTPEDITTGMSEKAILDYIKKQFTKKFSEKNEIGLYAIIREANQDELIFLFELVSHLKICDPAVGSAHFLESAIETMVHVYEEIWKRAISLNLKKKFYIQTGNETGEIVKIDITELHPEKEFEKEKFYLYIKYFIILSRNIYGVDISGRALKVAKARLFLTMAKHFNLEKNTFVRFPNVHFNLREGNSLVGYITLAEPPVNSKKRDIVSHDLFSFAAKDTNQLQKILEALPKEFKAKIQKLSLALGQKGKILLELEDLGNILANKKLDSADFKRALEIKSDLSQIHIASLSTNFALQLQSILEKINLLFREKLDARFVEEYELGTEGAKSLKRNQTFHWQMEFPEVFYLSPHSADIVKSNTSSPSPKRRGDLVAGFDIILGNPPYIQLQKIREQADLFEQLEYETFTKTGDIYCLFYERQIELLCSGGYGFFITSNSWMRTQYGAALRKYLLENSNPLLLLNFEDTQIFDAAIVEPNMLLLEKEHNAKQLEAASITSDYKAGSNLFIFFEKNKMHLVNLSDAEWSVGTQEGSDIKAIIERNGIKIEDIRPKIVMNYGIKTGYNNAFVIPGEIKKELTKNKKNANIIKPMLRGRDLKKYYYEFADQWIIFTRKGININEYPDIKDYLLQYKKELTPGVGRKPGSYEWYEIQDNVAYFEDFAKPKIIWGRISDTAKFTFDDKSHYVLDSLFTMQSHIDKYLIGILNSKVCEWYYYKICTTSGMGTAFWYKYNVEKIPIPRAPIDNPELQKPFETIVDYIITGKKLSQEMKNPSLNTFAEFFERVIDGMVFELFFADEFKAKGIKILEHLKDLPSILDRKTDLEKALF